MGLIREPKHVDFYVIDKPWTSSEKKEFSELIKKLKSRSKAKHATDKSKVRSKAA
ncbi:hypothetical protein BH09BAC5_BH09BAC5_03620 [soil metagenome]